VLQFRSAYIWVATGYLRRYDSRLISLVGVCGIDPLATICILFSNLRATDFPSIHSDLKAMKTMSAQPTIIIICRKLQTNLLLKSW